jgi:hypothetical protein
MCGGTAGTGGGGIGGGGIGGGNHCVAGSAGAGGGGTRSRSQDVNGDGYADIVIGGNSVGAVEVYLGGPCGPDSSPTVTLTSPQAPPNTFGVSVAFAGDVNRDGYADVVVGDQALERAYVYLGGAGGVASSPATTLVGPDAGLHSFGWSVAGAGDVNGDGFADVIIGTAAAGFDGKAPMRAFVYLGSGSGVSPTPAVTLTGPDGGGFGQSVASAGDVNHDGFADVIVGAGGASKAYLYMGSASGLASSVAVVLTDPDGPGNAFGQSVAGAGDVNGDGYSDVIVGAAGAGVGTGHAVLYLGSASGLRSTPALRLAGPDGPNDQFGISLASAGDVDRDGFGDVVIGAQTVQNSGRVYVYRGAATTGLSSTPAAALVSPFSNAGPGFGHCVAGAGDLDGDGYPDVLVGGVYYMGGPSGLSTTPAGQVGEAGYGSTVANADAMLRYGGERSVPGRTARAAHGKNGLALGPRRARRSPAI